MLTHVAMRTFSLTVLAVALLAGCDSTGISATTFCDQYAALFCEGNTNCCATTTDMYGSRAECEAARKATCTLGGGVAFTDGRAQFQSAIASQVLVDARTAVDACAPLPPLWAYDLVRGNVPAGGECSPVGDDWSPTTACAPNTTCVLTGDAAGLYQGRCVAVGLQGSPCSAETCAPNLYCSFAGTSGVCTLKLSNGGFCTTDSACVSGACVSGLCGTSSSGGAYCVPGSAPGI